MAEHVDDSSEEGHSDAEDPCTDYENDSEKVIDVVLALEGPLS
jgi:hypothetical protein